MSDPTMEPGILAKALDFAWAGVLALAGYIWKSNDIKHKEAHAAIKSLADTVADKIDHETRCVRIELKGKADTGDLKKALEHIEKLYQANESDRKESRDLHDEQRDRIERLSETMTMQHTKILEAMADYGMRGRAK